MRFSDLASDRSDALDAPRRMLARLSSCAGRSLKGVAAAALPALIAGCSHAHDPLQTLRAMDEASFRRELAARFQYPPPAPPPRHAHRGAGQLADADYVLHFPGYDRSYSPQARAQARRLSERLRAEAAALSRESFILRVAEIAALADNSHTALSIGEFGRVAPRIPLRAYLFADGLHVLHAGGANADLLGARIDGIDGRRIDAMYRVLRRYHGGLEPFRRRQLLPMLESPALLHAAGLADAPDRLLLSGVTAGGAPFRRELLAVEAGHDASTGLTQRLLYPDLLQERGMKSFLPAGEDLPVSLRKGGSFVDSRPLGNDGHYVRLDLTVDVDRPIEPFLAEVATHLRQQQPDFLVLDLRMNTGGDSMKTFEFARALPRTLPKARIYVLTSPWTRSAAMATAVVLKAGGGRRVRIVGERVGDRMDFWSEGGTFRLPNVGIGVDYAGGRHVFDGPCDDLAQCFWLDFAHAAKVRSLAPDVEAGWTFAAYRQGRDPALDAVLKLERNRRKAR